MNKNNLKNVSILPCFFVLLLLYKCQSFAGNGQIMISQREPHRPPPISCKYIVGRDVIASVNGQIINARVVRIGFGEKITFRCRDIGKFTFNGTRALLCTKRGFSSVVLPTCNRLTPRKARFPPMIEYGIDVGNSSVSDDGRLLLQMGSTVVFTCDWPSQKAIWLRNNKLIEMENGNKYKFWKGDLFLEIRLENVTEEYNGKYTCYTYPWHKKHDIYVTVVGTTKDETTKHQITWTTPATTNSTTILSQKTDTMTTITGPTATKPETTTSGFLCTYYKDHNMMAFVNGSSVTSNLITVGLDETVTFRCIDLGRFQFHGNHTVYCNKRFRKRDTPRCTMLEYRNSFMAPVITFEKISHENIISENGTVIVAEGCDLMVSCWWAHTSGDPVWYRNGHEIKDKNSHQYWEDFGKFVLHLTKATKDQNGLYTCTTPYGKHHGIDVLFVPRNNITKIVQFHLL